MEGSKQGVGAFDTLFNKRDHKAAERLWSSNNIQAIEAESQSGVPMF